MDTSSYGCMKIKELREILNSLSEDCDEFPVCIQLTSSRENPNIQEIDSNNWELDGHSIETSSLLFYINPLYSNNDSL